MPAEDCRRRRYRNIIAHVYVSDDGGKTWRRLSPEEIQEARELWRNRRNRRNQRRAAG